jgi:hypothetical protein
MPIAITHTLTFVWFMQIPLIQTLVTQFLGPIMVSLICGPPFFVRKNQKLNGMIFASRGIVVVVG